MKTLVIGNQKGGVGKSSTAFHLAHAAYRQGLRVVVVDTDPQANLSYSLTGYEIPVTASKLFNGDEPDIGALLPRDSAYLAVIPADDFLADINTQKMELPAKCFRSSVQALGKAGVDLLIVDTPPTLGVSLVGSLLSADFVLCPVELEVYSMLGIEKMYKTIMSAKKFNPNLALLGILPSKVDTRSARQKGHLQELRSKFPDAVLEQQVTLRSGIAEALSIQKPVWEIKKTEARKAAREVLELCDHVFNTMELTK